MIDVTGCVVAVNRSQTLFAGAEDEDWATR